MLTWTENACLHFHVIRIAGISGCRDVGISEFRDFWISRFRDYQTQGPYPPPHPLSVRLAARGPKIKKIKKCMKIQ